MTTVEVSAGIGALVVHFAEHLGADAEALARRTGFDPSVAADPDARIPLVLETALWEEAARLTGDDAFGLHAAAMLRPGAFDVLDYVVRTAPTLRASVERLVRYNRIVHDAASFALVAQGDGVRVEHALRIGGAQSRHAAEFTMASLIVIGSQLAGAPLRAREVGFRHGRPASRAAMAAHAEIFGIEPRFVADVNFVVIDAATLDRPNASADGALSRVIERHAQALLAARPEPTASVADRVRRVVAGALTTGAASLTAVAGQLHMSERSLQRKLGEESITFDALLDEVRRDLALRYLADPSIAVAEIAYLLGYSEPSAFHRAFKRWTGMTPSEARTRPA